MELKYKDMIKALNAVEEERNIPADVILDALKEAMAKAYKKDAELSDIDVVAEINEKKQTIDLFQKYTVVEEVEDDELEISLEDAREIKADAELGDVISRQIEITGMSRAAATLAKNVMRQKIREAEKVAVYNEYIDQLHEMVLGIVESVKEKFTLVNLGKTVAMMPHSSAIPGERLVEGQKLRVVITEVNKETKGSQVLVSRADATLVKRLFEKEVPEIFQGIVEIKAIARDAGERTKMAVYSHNPEVDPIGACIGPRGSRVMGIIEELHGEKIDIFQWSDDITELVKNALAPAEVTAVLPSPEDNEKGLLVVVEPDQLSLAIGKRGKNARLAVKLTNHKIDIKTREEIEEKGYDYDELLVKAQERREEMRREAARREIERLEAEARAAEEKRLAAAAKLAAERAARGEEETEEEDLIPEEMQEIMRDRIRDEIAMKPEDAEESTEETPAVETSAVTETPTEETEPEEVEEAEEPQEEEKEETVSEKPAASKRHADLEEMAAKNTYVSVFEKLTETSKPKQSDRPKRKKKKSDEDEYKVRNKDLEEQIKKNLAAVDNRPIYSEEELAEIEAAQLEEEEREYDFDYDEYEDYYDEDNN